VPERFQNFRISSFAPPYHVIKRVIHFGIQFLVKIYRSGGLILDLEAYSEGGKDDKDDIEKIFADFSQDL
jgi:hypothetical protein